MADDPTKQIYETQAEEWTLARQPVHLDSAKWIDEQRCAGPVIDVGTGPGWHLEPCQPPRVGLDVAKAMLTLSRERHDHPVVSASADALPFRAGSCGGAIASRVYNHLPLERQPMALADLHRSLAAESPVLFEFLITTDHAGSESASANTADPQPTDPQPARGQTVRTGPPFAGRLMSLLTHHGLADLLEGSGFEVVVSSSRRRGRLSVRARRRFSLPDTVGPEMRLLICGLNPSPTSAETGVGFGRPGNRFWPAALAAGLVSVDRDPRHALTNHGLGMTDLAKRTTRRADELASSEYLSGLERVERLVSWLQPKAVCFVGLAGWRAAYDRTAQAGPQTAKLGGRPVYVMPSTSGLNAGSTLSDLTKHLSRASVMADRS